MVCSICVLYDSHTDHNIKHIEDYCKGFKQTLPAVKSQLEEKYKKAREIYKKTKECQVASDKARRLIEDSCELWLIEQPLSFIMLQENTRHK